MNYNNTVKYDRVPVIDITARPIVRGYKKRSHKNNFYVIQNNALESQY